MVPRLLIPAIAALGLLGGCWPSDPPNGAHPPGQAWLIESMITIADQETIQVFLFRYDAHNRKVVDSSILQGGRGFVVRRTFDEADRTIREEHLEDGTITITDWTYTSFGKIASRRWRDPAGKEFGRDTSEYDGSRRLIQETIFAYGGSNPSIFTRYRYAGVDTLVDTVLNLDSAMVLRSKSIHTYAGDKVVESRYFTEDGEFRYTYRYDQVENFLEGVYSDKDGLVLSRVVSVYDGNGNHSKMTWITERPKPESYFILYRWKKASS